MNMYPETMGEKHVGSFVSTNISFPQLYKLPVGSNLSIPHFCVYNKNWHRVSKNKYFMNEEMNK